MVDEVVKTLQASVAPGLLISGFGFILLTMTNRLGRAVDRIYKLDEKLSQSEGEDAHSLCQQIELIYQRAKFLRSAIGLITFSIFTVAVNILLLFATLVFKVHLAFVIQIVFSLSLLSLILALVLFMLDISKTLQSIKIEMAKTKKKFMSS